MIFVPEIAPSLVLKSQTIYAQSNSELWLICMGWLMRGIGGWYLLEYGLNYTVSATEVWKRRRNESTAAAAAATQRPETQPVGLLF